MIKLPLLVVFIAFLSSELLFGTELSGLSSPFNLTPNQSGNGLGPRVVRSFDCQKEGGCAVRLFLTITAYPDTPIQLMAKQLFRGQSDPIEVQNEIEDYQSYLELSTITAGQLAVYDHQNNKSVSQMLRGNLLQGKPVGRPDSLDFHLEKGRNFLVFRMKTRRFLNRVSVVARMKELE